MLKSAREAKVLTSWINPHAGYEAALSSFVQAVAAAARQQPVPARPAGERGDAGLVRRAQRPDDGAAEMPVARRARHLPGARGDRAVAGRPRQPPCGGFPAPRVRCSTRRRRIAALADAPARAAALRQWLAGAVDGRAKFWVTWRALQLRRDAEAMLRRAEYLPLAVRGSAAQHVVAFARRDGAQLAGGGGRAAGRRRCGAGVGAAPVGECWGDTAIVWPEGEASSSASGHGLAGRPHRDAPACRCVTACCCSASCCENGRSRRCTVCRLPPMPSTAPLPPRRPMMRR